MKDTVLWILMTVILAGILAGQAIAVETPDIWSAAAKGNLDAIRRQLDNGTDVNSTFVQAGVPGSGATPLHLAVITGQLDAAKLLLEKGADIEAKAADEHKGTPLHWAAFVGRINAVKFLLEAGANVNAKDQHGNTVLDSALNETVQREDRPAVVKLLRAKGGKTSGKEGARENDVKPISYRGSYFKNGEIHVNTYGTPEGKPLTSGHQDFKPSWSKTGDMLVFFRRLKNDPVVTNWKTQIHIIKTDGTGLHPLTDGTHTDFNQTWMRDGTNTPIWNRRHPDRVSFQVMASKVGSKPGQEIALTDNSYHTWAYTCLIDGRILVQCAHPKQGWGYFLMTPNPGGEPSFERIDCELAKTGILDRVSISPSETKVCFEYQKGFQRQVAGRTLYIADFDQEKPSITNAKPFANEEGANRWFAYPRWTKDEQAIVYHASPSLYIYSVKDGSTAKVSTQEGADYRYPHMEATPK